MKRHTGISLLLPAVASLAAAQEIPYKANWESLDKRPTPTWFDDAKFGIFVVWGIYSVPAWAPPDQYAEWYWWQSKNPDRPEHAFHRKTYGEGFQYQDFLPGFTAELFDPPQWADLFARSGARYVVMTAQYHDGYCLWPSPYAWNWNSVDTGPHRDLVGELTEAVRAQDLKMGYYYSVYEWYHPDYRNDIPRYVSEHLHPQVKDLLTRYEPSILWADGEWEQTSETWRTEELLAWVFNESPSREEIVVNDRWGKDCRGRHGGFYTSEYGNTYGADPVGAHHKWEESQGMGSSYGYNRNESINDYNTATELIHLLADVVARGGNLLLDVGPTADGRIPVIMQQRLLDIGEWLDVNGEAIYDTSAWRETSESERLRYTSKKDALYAICFDWPGETLTLKTPKTSKESVVTLVGHDEPLRWRQEKSGVCIDVPQLTIDKLPARHAYVFKLTNVE